MTILLVGPNTALRVGPGQTGLYAPLPSSGSAFVSGSLSLSQLAAPAIGWWDASTPNGLIGSGDIVVGAWGVPGHAIADLSGSGNSLQSFASPASGVQVQIAPHLSGLLGGAGFPTTTAGLLQPSLDPSSGWQLPQAVLNAASNWTVFLVWSRPNWRQGSNADGSPITLLDVGGIPILQADSAEGADRLVLFPGSNQVVVSTSMTRRHTHSVVLRYSTMTGADMWLDQIQVARAAKAGSSFAGAGLLLHDGTSLGSAQCWLHEAAVWNVSLGSTDILAVLQYSGRWTCGIRRGLYLIFNGQSNAINYTEVDGASALLARGIAWHLGALAYNVLATTVSPTNFTMASGHGIYDVAAAGYPGSFVLDPGDGSDPSTWSLGADGLAVQEAISGLGSEDMADIAAIVWPWNETDSLRSYTELHTFQAAALRYLSLLRGLLGDTTNRIPLVWWNAIPYGTDAGIEMHRQAVQAIALTSAANVVVGNPQTSDSNPRGSSWNAATGIATGGDAAHRDSVDNLRFAVLAAPIIARRLLISGLSDSIATIPSGLPAKAGPSISHVYKSSPTTLIVTVAHDSGNDLKVPLQAATGIGFAVMDGGSASSPGTIVAARACLRTDATHLQISLAAPLQNTSANCLLYYPYGSMQIGRGNAVTDNYSAMILSSDWQANLQLGPEWSVDYPLAATFAGVVLSDTPY